MKKDENSIARAPQPITPECFNMTGMAMLPTVETPVKNLVAFTQLFHHFIGSNYKLNDISIITKKSSFSLVLRKNIPVAGFRK